MLPRSLASLVRLLFGPPVIVTLLSVLLGLQLRRLARLQAGSLKHGTMLVNKVLPPPPHAQLVLGLSGTVVSRTEARRRAAISAFLLASSPKR